MAGAESIVLGRHLPLPCRPDSSKKFARLAAAAPAEQGSESSNGEPKLLLCNLRKPRPRPRPRLKQFPSSLSGAGVVCSATPSTSSEDSVHSRESIAEVSHGAVLRGRRTVIALASLALPFLQFGGSRHHVEAVAGGFDKYVKKKKLDPLDTYVPTVLLAQSQFQEVDGKLGGAEKTYADARSLLRTGPAASLRTDIRAVAQYAAETGNKDGASAVEQCLSALEDLDFLLLQASRSQGAPIDRMRQDLTATVSALDRLLATVPIPILEKAREIAEAYKETSY